MLQRLLLLMLVIGGAGAGNSLRAAAAPLQPATVQQTVTDATGIISPQDSVSRIAADSTTVLLKQEKNRNVMLNASSNTAARDINIGLPSTAGGITLIENDLPVVYFYWPELSAYAWKKDATINKMGILKASELTIITGDVGYAVNSYDQTGTNRVRLNGNLTSNSFGLLNGTFNVSGPLKKNWYFTLGAYVNFDPETFDLKFTTYGNKSQVFKAGLTKRFGNGDISLFYKYTSSWAATAMWDAPFIYKKEGDIEELPGFKIGRDAYLPVDGTATYMDVLTGKMKTDQLTDNGKDWSHSIYLFGHNRLSKGLKLKYSLMYHYSHTSMWMIVPISTTKSDESTRFTYLDNGKDYAGNVQMMFSELIAPEPVQSLTSVIELSKKAENHSWRIGFNEWYFNVHKFHSNTSFFYQEVAPNPQKLSLDGLTDNNGYFNYNAASEYHNGHENKTALYAMDDWSVNKRLFLSGGARMEYHKLKGDYYTQPRTDKIVLSDYPVTNFNNNWLYVKFSLNGVYRIGKKYGILGGVTYNESRGKLEDYSGADTPALKLVKDPMGQFGIYFNNKHFKLTSGLTYIKQTNYQSRITLVDPENSSNTIYKTIYYDVSTAGWTTDINATPFKNFTFHYRLTYQNPIYKNYSIEAFGNQYDYSDKNVTEISKVLMEIDPAYQVDRKLRLWLSARYYSKQFANVTNVLYFKSHWETFGGASYNFNKNLDAGLSVVNILNQRGAKGTIQGANLITNPIDYYNTVMTGSYIIPFTAKFTLNFHF